MGHIYDGGVKLFVKLCYFHPHLCPQLGIQIGQGFVHKISLWLSHNHASDCNPLLLSS